MKPKALEEKMPEEICKAVVEFLGPEISCRMKGF
jgi:hypothetical protein